MIRKKKKVKKVRKLVNDCPHCDYIHRCYKGIVSAEAVKASCWACGVKVKKATPLEEEQEECPIRLPKRRRNENGLPHYYAVTSKPVYHPPDAKWKTLRQWAEDARDETEAERKFLTASGVLNLLRTCPIPEARKRKAVRRLKVLYGQELEIERAVLQSMANQAFKKDLWGNDKAPNAAPEPKGPVKEHASGKKATAKKPGVITRIVELLKKANPVKPITKDEILADLVKSFPDRSKDAMRNTINSQIPSCLRKEKGIEVQQNKKGYWIEEH